MFKLNKKESFNIQDISERRFKLFDEYSLQYANKREQKGGYPHITFFEYSEKDSKLRIEEESWWRKMEKNFGLTANGAYSIVRINGDFFIEE